jgi:hypothetical protein
MNKLFQILMSQGITIVLPGSVPDDTEEHTESAWYEECRDIALKEYLHLCLQM